RDVVFFENEFGSGHEDTVREDVVQFDANEPIHYIAKEDVITQNDNVNSEETTNEEEVPGTSSEASSEERRYPLRERKSRYFPDQIRHEAFLASFGEPTMSCALAPCVYHRGSGETKVIIGIYVDDILLLTRNEKEKHDVKRHLALEFEIRDLGQVSNVLGIRVTRDKNKIFLDQSNYITELLDKYNMSNCSSVTTPFVTGKKLEKASISDKRPYRELIGSLNYLSICTRPDISHTVSYLSKFNECHNEEHWLAAKRVLRYLKGTSNFFLCYEKSDLRITGYVDADFANDESDRKSCTGYAFLMGNGAISWESKKQSNISISTCEAEYVAISEACKEAKFLRCLLSDLTGEVICIDLYNDNQSAHVWAYEHMPYTRTKHIDIKHAKFTNGLGIKSKCCD
ncbi:hypothetical protein KPH14_012665, partial [Odynerus spinipes]